MGVRSLRSSISLSVFIHTLLFAAWGLLFSRQVIHEPQKLVWIDLAPSVPNLKKQNEKVQNKVVQTTEGQRTDTAAPNAFLGERTQTVDRETVSREQKTVLAERAKPKGGKRAKPQTSESISAANPLSRLGVAILPGQRVGPNQTEERSSEDSHDWANYGQSPQDYAPGLKESDRTALNTKEFVFFGYFQRIRKRLDLAWEPVLREHLLKFYKEGRRLASEMDHTTKLVVTLNARGEITQVEVMEASGTQVLDDAAIRAFNKAGPFPNPPAGIADLSGRIQIRWDFILKT